MKDRKTLLVEDNPEHGGAKVAKPLRVLIVEESEDDALLLLGELRRGGYLPESQRTSTGPETEAALQQKWDIVISNPGSASQVLEQEGVDIPCIVVSARVDETIILNAMKAGAADCLVMDNLARLSPAVDQALRRAAACRERSRLEQQSRHAQKMEAMGRLAGGVAHDFNNLLTVIAGHAELLLGGCGISESTRFSLREIQKAAARGDSLMQQLLIFSRRQKLSPKSVHLNDLVTNVEKMLRRLIPENISLLTVLRADLGVVRADMGQFEQVVINLVANARDAMPRGGKLTIETANVTWRTPQVDLPAGAYVMLAIGDTGIGMDVETESHVFEPFFTTKGPGKGAGLGLAMVYGIVKQSGGSIVLNSEPGQGTTFKIYLPRVDQPVEGVAEAALAARPMARSETVLVVEHDTEVRRLIRESLSARGYRVLESTKGEDAVRMVRTFADPVHLVVADVILPETSGPEVVRQVKEWKPGIRALYISSYTDDAVLRSGILESGVAFLSKPFLPEALARKVQEVLGGQ